MKTCFPPKPSTGFTLIELVMVIIILGILSVAAIPRFFDNSIFQARGFADQLLATLRYAQKSAIAEHRLVCADMTVSTITLTIDRFSTGSCSEALNLPDRTGSSITAPTGITLSPATALTFDALGRANSTISITISGVTTPITVVAETGYVYQ
jgi:MSHA pilin protein MshC